MKALIVYYSFTGNNEALALELREKLSCDIFKIVEVKRRTSLTIFFDLLFKRKSKIQKPEIHLNQYDKVILTAPVWGANIATPMKAFLELERDNLEEYSFIDVCSGRPGQAERMRQQLTQLIGKEPTAILELKINDLLPLEKKDNTRYTTPYRIKKTDLEEFKQPIENFVKAAKKYNFHRIPNRAGVY